jgi:hypothetical protein
LRIVRDVQLVNEDFVQKRDATGKFGLSAQQKVTVALRQLAYGYVHNIFHSYALSIPLFSSIFSRVL